MFLLWPSLIYKYLHTYIYSTHIIPFKLVTDRRFYQPLFNVVKFHVNAINTNRHPAYFYKFNFQGPFSYSSLYAGGVPKHDYGVVHHDDTLYMFRSPLVFPDYGKNSSDAGVIRQFVDSFVNFAHFR